MHVGADVTPDVSTGSNADVDVMSVETYVKVLYAAMCNKEKLFYRFLGIRWIFTIFDAEKFITV